MGTLSAILRVPVRSVAIERVEKAEAILLEIRKAIDSNRDEDYIKTKSDMFFNLIPHRLGYDKPILTKQIIARKQDVCQLIKDIVNANESTGWSQLSDAASKYRALNCMIDWLKPGHVEREQVEKLVISTQDEDCPVTIHNVFAVSRSIEEAGYNHSVGNDKLLLHCSRPANFLGILSRIHFNKLIYIP
ncbi:protein mono-ADP-ribosyltransferase PARP4-like [Amphiura filiformis]|uniref:protein mono-ADP-ribosyltransferase PARP4-like n=1 Tax=Amphiura filiformis TaxID=82378 RepID=UPI003B21D457